MTRGGRPGRALPPPLAVGAAVGVLVGAGLVLAGVGWQSWQPGYDLAVYRHGAQDLLAGRDLYARVTDRGHYFVYPPFAAVLFLPLLLLPPQVDLLLWGAVLVLVTVAAAVRVLRSTGAGPLLGGAGVALVLVSDPFREALVLGQVSPLVVAALVLGCSWGGRGGAVPAALAGAVKVTPALVVAVLVNRRARSWFALPVVVAGAVTTLLGALVAPASWRSYFTDLLFDSARVARPGTTSNNSLAGAFAHAGAPDAVAGLLAGLLAVPLLVLVVLAARRADWLVRADRVRFGLLVSLVTCLASPVTWSHHALAAPLAVAVAAVAGGGALRRVVLVLLAAVWLLPVLQVGAELGGPVGTLLAETRPLSLLLLVAGLARDLLRARPVHGAAGVPAGSTRPVRRG